jgi:hypothetical protein
MASEPTPSRLVGNRKSMTLKPVILTSATEYIVRAILDVSGYTWYDYVDDVVKVETKIIGELL